MDFVGRIAEPIFFLNQINPNFQSPLRSDSIVGKQISKLNGFLLNEVVPLLCKQSPFRIQLGVP